MPNDKPAKLARLLRRTRAALSAMDRQRAKVRVWTYPHDASIPAFERRVVLERAALYPEDYASYTLYTSLFRDVVPAATPGGADYLFVPVFLPAYELIGAPLGDAIERLEFINSGKRHLVFSSWDTYPRPIEPRANPFCTVAARPPEERARYNDHHRWLDDRFTLITFESSIDLWPNDVAALPARPDRARSPDAPGRDLLFSFAGTIHYASVPSGHIRGDDHREAWLRLRASSTTGAGGGESGARWFVGSQDEAQAIFGVSDQAQLSQRSVFTLCPAGFARWSFRLSEAVVSGSIPVILSDYYHKPFARHLPWDTFSITLPERALPDVGVILSRLSPEVVNGLKAGLARVQRYFRPAGLAELVLDELASKIHRR